MEETKKTTAEKALDREYAKQRDKVVASLRSYVRAIRARTAIGGGIATKGAIEADVMAILVVEMGGV